MGAVMSLVDLLKTDDVEAAIASRVPRGTEELNLKAFRRGLEMGRAARE